MRGLHLMRITRYEIDKAQQKVAYMNKIFHTDKEVV